MDCDEPQGLEDSCLQCCRGAAIWPSRLSDQNRRSCLCREKGVDTASIKGAVKLGVLFFFKFYCVKGNNYWVTIFLHGRFLFKVLLIGGVRWVGILDAIVEETVLLHLCFINVCVYVSAVFFLSFFFFQLFSDTASCFSRTHT